MVLLIGLAGAGVLLVVGVVGLYIAALVMRTDEPAGDGRGTGT